MSESLFFVQFWSDFNVNLPLLISATTPRSLCDSTIKALVQNMIKFIINIVVTFIIYIVSPDYMYIVILGNVISITVYLSLGM